MPTSSTRYFQKAGARPAFNPAITGFDRDKAWWLAECSRLAYENKRRVYDELALAGFDLVIFIDSVATQGYIAAHPGMGDFSPFAVLAFRGTENDWGDILTGIAFMKSTLPDEFRPSLTAGASGTAAHRAHTGFIYGLKVAWGISMPVVPPVGAMRPPRWYGAKGISDAIYDVLEDKGYNTPIFMTGHSLGAALAVLTSLPIPPAALYTYGCPRVVESKLAAVLDRRQTPVFRVVNSTDIVPRVPFALWNFTHFGRLAYLTPGGACITGARAQFLFVLGSAFTWLGFASLLFPAVWITKLHPKIFSNHRISEYCEKLA